MILFNNAKIQKTSVPDLGQADKMEIWRLLEKFHSTDLGYFLDSLHRHKEVIRFRRKDTAELIGFASIDVLQGGSQATIIFTSNVVIEPEFRGHNLIQRVGLETYIRT